MSSKKRGFLIVAALLWNGLSLMLPPEVGIPLIAVGVVGLIALLCPALAYAVFSKLPTPAQIVSSKAANLLGVMTDTPRRDVWVLNAIHFIAYGSWERQEGKGAEAHKFAITDAIRRLEQAALDGEIPIWGKAGHAGKYFLIEPQRWSVIEIREQSVFTGEPVSVYARTKYGHGSPERYNELKTNKAKVMAWHATQL